MVIMNQEEKVLNTDSSKNCPGVSMKNTALGGAKLHKFTLLVMATLISLFEIHSPCPKFRVSKVLVADLVAPPKLVVKIRSFEIKQGSDKKKIINLQNNSIFLLLYQGAVIIESESSDVNVVSLSAAISSDFNVNIPCLKGNISQSVKVDFK